MRLHQIAFEVSAVAEAVRISSKSHLMSNLIRQIMIISISIATGVTKAHIGLSGIHIPYFRPQ